jgi:hypothetical protein
MKRTAYAGLVALLYVLAGAFPACAQIATVLGTVSDGDKPLSGVQVIYKNPENGRQIKMKTDSKGKFMALGVPNGVYNVSVLDASGKMIFSHNSLPVGQGGDDAENVLTIDITKGAIAKTPKGALFGGSGVGGQTSEFKGPDAAGDTAPKNGGTMVSKTTTEDTGISSEERDRINAQNAKAKNINELFAKYQAAASVKNWAAAIPPLQGMVAIEPNHWEYLQALADAQLDTGDYEGAVQSYDKGIHVAESYASGTAPKDSKNPYADPAKAKAGMGQMFTGEGNAYLKLNKSAEAIAAYTKAADLDPNSAVAYFNLCATQYNIGNMDGASVICDKAIQADPNRADAYFIKGAAMYGNGKMDANNKYVVPSGTSDALQKYLELAPDGSHAADVKAMLQALGVPIETTYKVRGKKK